MNKIDDEQKNKQAQERREKIDEIFNGVDFEDRLKELMTMVGMIMMTEEMTNVRLDIICNNNQDRLQVRTLLDYISGDFGNV